MCLAFATETLISETWHDMCIFNFIVCQIFEDLSERNVKFILYSVLKEKVSVVFFLFKVSIYHIFYCSLKGIHIYYSFFFYVLFYYLRVHTKSFDFEMFST